MQQLVLMHLVVYHHHKPTLDTQHRQIRHYSKGERERVRERGKGGKRKKREERKRKEKKREPGRWKKNERRRVEARKNLGIIVMH